MRRVYAVAAASLSFEPRRATVHAWQSALRPPCTSNGPATPAADRLVSEDPAALLIGFCLDQQIPIEWAFQGPLRMRERLGTVDPVDIAHMDPAKVEKAFQTPPALHRFPGEHGATRLWALRGDRQRVRR